MSYSYVPDRKAVGDLSLMPSDWKILRNAMQLLYDELMKWNQIVGDSGGRKIPYEQEVQDLHRIMISISKIIKYGNVHGGFLVERGVSVGTQRLKKASLILLLCRSYENIENKKKEGWPSAALDSLNEEIEPINKLLNKQEFKYEPHDVLWQLISKEQYEGVINLKQHS